MTTELFLQNSWCRCLMMANKSSLNRSVAHVHPCSLSLVKTTVSAKVFDPWKLGRTRMHIFTAISFALVILIFILAISLLSHHSFDSVACETESYRRELQILDAQQPVEPVKMVEQEKYFHDTDDGNFGPPFNLTVEERISWFKNKLSVFDMFKSTKVTRQFESRVREFSGSDCQLRFFMTWISPTVSFGRRQFLAMESIFKAHPDGCLIILSKTLDSGRGTLILKPLLDRGNRVLAVTPDLSFLFKNTAAESWFKDIKNGKKDPGEIPLAQNLSNLMRLAVLYKYGGVYLDTDFIVLKDFSMLRNTIGAQSTDANGKWTRLNNAVLVFDKNHPLLYMFMEEFKFTFNGNRWGHNGPYLVSRVVSRVATMQEFNFTVLPPMAFYPVDWSRIDGYFIRPSNPAYSKWVEAKLRQLSGETYGVHLWNRESGKTKIQEGSIIGRLISAHCIICQDIYGS